MRTKLIDRNQWSRFAEEFTQRWHGSVVSIETLDDRGAQHEVEREPLDRITVHGRGSRVTLMTGRDDYRNRYILHDVSAIWLEETDDGVANCVEVETESGARTLMSFASRSAPRLSP